MLKANAHERVEALGRVFDSEAETPPCLRTIELGDLLGLPLEKPAELAGNLLRQGSQNMGHGPAGVGKTNFGLAMGVHLTHGADFLGYAIPKPWPVLYIDGEMAAYDIQQRVKAFSTPLDALHRALHFLTPDLQERGIPKIDTAEGQIELLRIVDAIEDLKLVIIDNLSCLTNPEDDNAAGSWSVVQELLLALRRRQIATWLWHHSGKGGQQRGTSRRADILDVILKLTPEAGQDDGRTRVLCEFEKGRHLTAEQKAPFTIALETHPAGGLMWTRSLAQVPVGDRIREMLMDGMPPGDVASELKTTRSFVYRVKQELISTGALGDSTSRGKTRRSRTVVPYSPDLYRGKGDTRNASTERRWNAGDKTGDKQGDSWGTAGTHGVQT